MFKFITNSTVLIVDDEKEIRDSYEDIFKTFFAKVYVASNGIEAIEQLQKNQIDVVFVDYEMPKMDGYEFVQEVRKKDDNIIITIISNHSEKNKLQKCIPLGLMGYIFKPLNYSTMLEHLYKIEDVLKIRHTKAFKIGDKHTFEPHSAKLICEDEEYILTKLEYEFLMLFLNNQGKMLYTEDLYNILSHFSENPSIKDIIYRMKKKYAFDRIKNIKNIGYILLEE